MVGLKLLTFYQSLIDFCFFLLVFFTYFNRIFQYMDDYDIGILAIRYYFNTDDGLEAYVRAPFDDFDKYFCDKQKNLKRLSEVCDNYSNFKSAGIVFIVLSSISMAFMLYGQIYLVGRMFKSQRAFFSFKFAHIIYPIVFSLAVACYLGISQIFTLSPPSKDCSNEKCQVEPEVGIYSLFAAELACLASLLLFVFSNKRINRLLYPPELTK